MEDYFALGVVDSLRPKFSDGGVANYKKYIDAIKALLVTYSDVKVILVIGT